MLGAVWLCVLTLALPCCTYPSGHPYTCEEFGRGVSFDPVNVVGEWFNVNNVEEVLINDTDKTTIRELTSSQLEQYDKILTDCSKDKLKLEVKSRISYPVVIEAEGVLVPQDDAGNVDIWITRVQIGSSDVPILNPGPHRIKWKIVDGFLVMRFCSFHIASILSKTTTPDKDKLQRAVDSLFIEGVIGNRVYSSLLTLL